MTELPTPLTPADCDLRDFMFMPLDVLRLRDSDIAVISSGDEFRCAVLLWCASWHQVPAASLPDDDVILSGLSGFGRVIKEWKKVREGALRGWIKCIDGRLYHPVVAEKANEAWRGRLDYREKKEAERVRKANLRAAQKAAEEAEEKARRLANCPPEELDLSGGQNTHVQRTDIGSPAETALRGTVDSGQQTVDRGKGQLPPDTGPGTHASNVDGANSGTDVCHDVGQISIAMRGYGINASSNHPTMIAFAEQGVLLDTLHLACKAAKKKKPNEAISPNFVIGFIRNWKADADAMNVAGATAPRNSPSSKDKSRAAAAASIGLGGKHEHRIVTIDAATGDVED